MITVDLSCEELNEVHTYAVHARRQRSRLGAATGTEERPLSCTSRWSRATTWGRHTDSVEDLLLVLDGEGVAVVGDERAEIGPGTMALVQAFARTEVYATGDRTLRVVGFFKRRRGGARLRRAGRADGARVLTTPMVAA